MLLISAIAGFVVGRLTAKDDDDNKYSASGRSSRGYDYTDDYGRDPYDYGTGTDDDRYSASSLDDGLKDFDRLLQRDLLGNGYKPADNRDYSFTSSPSTSNGGYSSRSGNKSGRSSDSRARYNAFLDRLLDYYDSKR